MAERPLTAPLTMETSENTDHIQRPSTGSSATSFIQNSRSKDQSKRVARTNKSEDTLQQIQRERSIEIDSQDPLISEKESFNNQTASQPFVEQKPYYHDVLVIQTQPPKVKCSHRFKIHNVGFYYYIQA